MRIKQATMILIFLILVSVIKEGFSFRQIIPLLSLSPSSLHSLSMTNTQSTSITTTTTNSATPTPTTTSSSPKQISEDWAKGFQDCQEELCQVIGENLPIDLRGTLYR